MEKQKTSISAQRFEQISKAIHGWRHSWDVVRYDTRTDISRPLGRDGKIGKECVMDAKIFEWEGVLFVNQPDSLGMKIFQEKVE
jgi:hypothetical protein